MSEILIVTTTTDSKKAKPKECESVVIKAHSDYDIKKVSHIVFEFSEGVVTATSMKGNQKVGKIYLSQLFEHIVEMTITGKEVSSEKKTIPRKKPTKRKRTIIPKKK